MTDESSQNPKRQILTLVMTEHCNLKCTYCFESKKQDKSVLSLEVAQTAITKAFQNPDYDQLEINFFGGEPLVAFKTITEICEWVWSERRPKPYVMFATTNGTLVHGKIKEWFEKHKDYFILSLSLDGTPEMHNANRSNSFADIDIDFFKKTWPLQTVKMTISNQTIAKAAEGIFYLQDMGLQPYVNIANGLEWQSDDYDSFVNEMKKLADYYLMNPEKEPCNIITMPLDRAAQTAEYIAQSGEKKVANRCGAGTSILCIDRCGTKYPCQTFMPMCAGSDSDLDKAAKLLACEDNYSDPKCKNCCLVPVCHTCYGINYVKTGSPFMNSEHDCIFTKIRAKATAFLLSEMITNRDRGYSYLKDKSDSDIYYMIKGINLVNNSVVI